MAKHEIKRVFLDVDMTMTDKKGDLMPNIAEGFKELINNCVINKDGSNLYIVTSGGLEIAANALRLLQQQLGKDSALKPSFSFLSGGGQLLRDNYVLESDEASCYVIKNAKVQVNEVISKGQLKDIEQAAREYDMMATVCANTVNYKKDSDVYKQTPAKYMSRTVKGAIYDPALKKLVSKVQPTYAIEKSEVVADEAVASVNIIELNSKYATNMFRKLNELPSLRGLKFGFGVSIEISRGKLMGLADIAGELKSYDMYVGDGQADQPILFDLKQKGGLAVSIGTKWAACESALYNASGWEDVPVIATHYQEHGKPLTAGDKDCCRVSLLAKEQARLIHQENKSSKILKAASAIQGGLGYIPNGINHLFNR